MQKMRYIKGCLKWLKVQTKERKIMLFRLGFLAPNTDNTCLKHGKTAPKGWGKKEGFR